MQRCRTGMFLKSSRMQTGSHDLFTHLGCNDHVVAAALRKPLQEFRWTVNVPKTGIPRVQMARQHYEFFVHLWATSCVRKGWAYYSSTAVCHAPGSEGEHGANACASGLICIFTRSMFDFASFVVCCGEKASIVGLLCAMAMPGFRFWFTWLSAALRYWLCRIGSCSAYGRNYSSACPSGALSKYALCCGCF